MRLTKSSDVIGIQLCGTIKNAFAIGSGILNGLNCLESTKASYLTQCLNETRKLLIKLNCSEETALEYAGIHVIVLRVVILVLVIWLDLKKIVIKLRFLKLTI